MNQNESSNPDNLKLKALIPLSVGDFKIAIESGITILDTRPATQFTNGFIPGAIFIGLEGKFREWAGKFLSNKTPIILIPSAGEEEETVIQLANTGIENIHGYLVGGFEAWQNAGEKVDLIIDVEADELALDIAFDENLLVLDVRKPAEFAANHVKDALNIPLDEMKDIAQIASLEEDKNMYVHCAWGYRSVIAASLLKRQGYQNLRNIVGGFEKIQAEKSIQLDKDITLMN